MPDCPKCGGEMGLWERGLICSSCFKTWLFTEARNLPGYNSDEVLDYIVLYEELFSLNLLQHGLNAVMADSDGVIIIHEGDQF